MKDQIQLLEAGQKLLGLILNLRNEADYLPDFYYEWMDRLISETDEILSDIDPVATPKGEVDIEYPFHKFVPENDSNEAIEALK